ncbi:MAG: DUF1289 domain-containing protein [Flavobacteriaceae bacterium]
MTPCIGICRRNKYGYCEGCKRSSEEITKWASLNPNEQFKIMEQLSTRDITTPKKK